MTHVWDATLGGGQIVNTPGPFGGASVAWGFAQPGAANVLNNYIKIPSGGYGPMDWAPRCTFTVEFWARYDDWGQASPQERTICSRGSQTINAFYFNITPTGQVRVALLANIPPGGGTGSSQTSTATPFNNTNWHWVRIVLGAPVSGQTYPALYVYVDGTCVIAYQLLGWLFDGTALAPGAAAYMVYVGGQAFTGTQEAFNGGVAEFAVWDHDVYAGSHAATVAGEVGRVLTASAPSVPYATAPSGMIALYHGYPQDPYSTSSPGGLIISPGLLAANANNNPIESIKMQNTPSLMVINCGPTQDWLDDPANPPTFTISPTPTYPQGVPSFGQVGGFQTAQFAAPTDNNAGTYKITPSTNSALLGRFVVAAVPFAAGQVTSPVAIGLTGVVAAIYGVNTAWPTTAPYTGFGLTLTGAPGGGVDNSALVVTTLAPGQHKASFKMSTGTRAGTGYVNTVMSSPLVPDNLQFPFILATAAVTITPTLGAVMGNDTVIFTASNIMTPGDNFTWTCSSGSFASGSGTVTTITTTDPVTWIAPSTGLPRTATITATSTSAGVGGSATMQVGTVVPPGTPSLTRRTQRFNGVLCDVFTVTPVPAGTYPVAGYQLRVGVAPDECDSVVDTISGAISPLGADFDEQARPTPGQVLYYQAVALDNQAPQQSGAPSPAIQSSQSAQGATGTPTTRVFAAAYLGSTGYGPQLGYTVYDSAGLELIPRAVGLQEVYGTGFYVCAVPCYDSWSGFIVLDAPSGYAPVSYDVTPAHSDISALVQGAIPPAKYGTEGGLPLAGASGGVSVGGEGGLLAVSADGSVNVNLRQLVPVPGGNGTGGDMESRLRSDDAHIELGDALIAALVAAFGQEAVVALAYQIMTPHGTPLFNFKLDSSYAPSARE